MKRLIPTAVVGFAILMLMYRGFSLESDRAANATNNSTALDVVDGVLQSGSQATSFALPNGMLVAVIAGVLAVGYLVGWK